MKIQFQKQEVRVCAVWPIRLMYAGATFEMPDYCLLVVNSRGGVVIWALHALTLSGGVQGRATRGDRGRCEHIT